MAALRERHASVATFANCDYAADFKAFKILQYSVIQFIKYIVL